MVQRGDGQQPAQCRKVHTRSDPHPHVSLQFEWPAIRCMTLLLLIHRPPAGAHPHSSATPAGCRLCVSKLWRTTTHTFGPAPVQPLAKPKLTALLTSLYCQTQSSTTPHTHSSTTLPNVAFSRPPMMSPNRTARSSVTSPRNSASGMRARKFCSVCVNSRHHATGR